MDTSNPNGVEVDHVGDVRHSEMSLRDHFAASALVGLLSHFDFEDSHDDGEPKLIAEAAYVLANAMMRARCNSPSPTGGTDPDVPAGD